MRKSRSVPGVNAGSMADIAFLLLIFFLVVTTITKDKGIQVLLPEYYIGPPGKAPDRNVLTILINAEGELLVDKKSIQIGDLHAMIVDFIRNPRSENEKPRSPEDAILSIQHDAKTTYEIYIQIYGIIHHAYHTIRNGISRDLFAKSYDLLTPTEKEKIIKKIPMKLSEADPFELP